MKYITRYFLNGLLLVAPVGLTIYILYFIFIRIDRLIPLPVPGLGFIVILIIVTLIGFLGSNFLTRNIINRLDRTLNHLPFIKLIYSSLKDLINAFVGEKKGFDKPVLVSLFQNSPARAIGFITRAELNQFGLKEHVAVYFPQSYNFAGQLLILPKENVIPLNISGPDAMRLIVSGGISCEPNYP